jgi:hypothetical protein
MRRSGIFLCAESFTHLKHFLGYNNGQEWQQPISIGHVHRLLQTSVGYAGASVDEWHLPGAVKVRESRESGVQQYLWKKKS